MLPRFYPILDTRLFEERGLPLEDSASALLDGGARILQVRHKGHFSRALFAALERIAARCRRSGAILVANDRADIAALLDAALHVGQEDLPPAEARKVIGPARLIGLSTHNPEQIRAANREPADYLALGPIFSTGSKVNPDPVVGLEALREWRKLTPKPLVAIGGITRETAPGVLTAGADSIAVIGDLVTGVESPADLRRRAADWVAVLRGARH